MLPCHANPAHNLGNLKVIRLREVSPLAASSAEEPPFGEWTYPLANCIEHNLHWLQGLAPTSSPLTVAQALANLNQQRPYVWLAVATIGHQPTVIAASSLYPLYPLQSAHLHGISAIWLRKTPYKPLLRQAINRVTLAALDTAFIDEDCAAVLATIGRDNRGARGFCWQNGFRQLSATRHTTTYQLTYPRYLAQRGQLLATLTTGTGPHSLAKG